LLYPWFWNTLQRVGEDFHREVGEWPVPVTVDRGPGHVRCGNHSPEVGVYHESVAAVRACYAMGEDMAREQAAEIWAENTR
jgi:hypothetical protein